MSDDAHVTACDHDWYRRIRVRGKVAKIVTYCRKCGAEGDLDE